MCSDPHRGKNVRIMMKACRVVLWNDEMQRLTSLTRADVTGMSVNMLVPDAEAVRLDGLTKRLLSGSAELGETLSVQFFCSKHSQSARLDTGIKKKVVDLMVSSSASPWLMSSSCITFIGQDVTAAKKVLGSAAVG